MSTFTISEKTILTTVCGLGVLACACLAVFLASAKGWPTFAYVVATVLPLAYLTPFAAVNTKQAMKAVGSSSDLWEVAYGIFISAWNYAALAGVLILIFSNHSVLNTICCVAASSFILFSGALLCKDLLAA